MVHGLHRFSKSWKMQHPDATTNTKQQQMKIK
jgi:hypothetical protein